MIRFFRRGVLLCLTLCVLPHAAWARGYLQSFEHGGIDWSNGVIEARGTAKPHANSLGRDRGKALLKEEAIQIARRNLLEVVNRVKRLHDLSE